MIRNIENLRRAMMLERRDPMIKAHFFGSNGQQVVVFRKHDEEIARGVGIDAETAYRKAYEELTGKNSSRKADVPSMGDDATDERASSAPVDTQAAPKRRRGRPRKAEVTAHSDLEADAQD